MKKYAAILGMLLLSAGAWADCNTGARHNPRGPVGGPGFGFHRGDNDNNPPGRLGGRGTNWENPRGPAGGPGWGPRRGDNDNNPPGRLGGRGTNWERANRQGNNSNKCR